MSSEKEEEEEEEEREEKWRPTHLARPDVDDGGQHLSSGVRVGCQRGAQRLGGGGYRRRRPGGAKGTAIRVENYRR